MPRRTASSVSYSTSIVRALSLLVLLLVSACHGGDEVAAQCLTRLERLSFLPAGDCYLPLYPGGGLNCSTSSALLVDRFEVTREEWDAYRVDQGLDAIPGAPDARATPRWPAVWMNFDEAGRFAAAQGMRLPTAREWLRIAAGTRAQRWPWSSQDAESVTNTLDLGLGRPTDVGSFPLGATSNGVHDLLGNAREWVTGELGPLQNGEGGAWVLGGSFLEHKRPIYQRGRAEGLVVCGELIDPARRSKDTGLRLVADAELFLRDTLRDWKPSAAERTRLVAIGRAWGPAARPLLESLAAGPDAAPACADLLEGSRQ